MDFYLQVGIVLEIIAMNMMIYKSNSHRRYPAWVIRVVILLFTILLTACCYLLLKNLPMYGNGNGLFTLAGFLYLIPLHWLFKETLRHNIFVMCFAWTYTLLIFTISVQIGYLLDTTINRYLSTFCAQSVLFGISSVPILRFMKDTYMVLLSCTDIHIQNYLHKSTYLWFITILFINLNVIFPAKPLLHIAAFAVIGWNILFSFHLIKEMLLSDKVIGNLKAIASTDSLTGLKNRAALYFDAQEKQLSLDSLYLLFLDLDSFKQINDKYGHLCGDRYLMRFADELRSICKEQNAEAYRISGDEFIILSHNQPSEIQHKLDAITFSLSDVMFLGVSYGTAAFPEDGKNLDALIRKADQQMYKKKAGKRHIPNHFLHSDTDL